MPLKLQIAMSRKVGESNYGSRGATVGLELEVDSSLIHQPQQLDDQVAQLFRLARASIDRELATAPRSQSEPAEPAASVRPVTANQLRALAALAQRQGVDLADEVRQRFGIERPEDLALPQASQLIDVFQVSANGRPAREDR